MRKKSKQSISLIQRKLWEECRRIAKKIYKNDCYTCEAKNLIGSNCQLGHLWAKASLGAFLKYDLRVLRWQCSRCNIWGGGMGADFYLRMWQEKGAEFMEQLKKDRQVTVKAYDHYQQLLEKYKTL
jgi:Bacteriophage Lambda NinG protein.